MLAFTDTWFSENINVFQLPGYNCEYVYCTSRTGCGVALYLAYHLPYVVIPEFTVINLNYKSMVLRYSKTLIAVIYRPPSGVIPMILEFVEVLLEYATT